MAVDLLGDRIAPASKAKRPPTRRNGYAAAPGSGPKGETCRSCAHSRPIQTPSRKRFWKCALIKETHGAGTDIRVRSPACNRWEKPDA